MIVGSTHRSFPMLDSSRVGEVRRHAASLAESLGWDDVLSGKLAIVVTELASNLVRHSNNGRVLIAARKETSEIELICIDDGPGMSDVGGSMADGYSTGGTPGTGLGAVKRLADDFDIHSVIGRGTVSVARLRAKGKPASARMQLGAICLALEGEQVSGDGWAACIDGERAALLVADGLGHGPDAAKAAAAATTVFSDQPFGDLKTLLNNIHSELRTTRGAAICGVQIDAEANSIRSGGAGNVMARIVSGVSDKAVITQHGTAGLQVRKFEETTNDWPPHALLVMYTDGVTSRWSPDLLYPVLGRDPSLAAALILQAHSRGRDDTTVVVLSRKD